MSRREFVAKPFGGHVVVPRPRLARPPRPKSAHAPSRPTRTRGASGVSRDVGLKSARSAVSSGAGRQLRHALEQRVDVRRLNALVGAGAPASSTASTARSPRRSSCSCKSTGRCEYEEACAVLLRCMSMSLEQADGLLAHRRQEVVRLAVLVVCASQAPRGTGVSRWGRGIAPGRGNRRRRTVKGDFEKLSSSLSPQCTRRPAEREWVSRGLQRSSKWMPLRALNKFTDPRRRGVSVQGYPSRSARAVGRLRGRALRRRSLAVG